MTTPATVDAQGEDRSDYQLIEPWTGDDFGGCKATEGTTWTGQTFPANWAALRKAELPRIAYHFLHPGMDPVAQARHFIAVVTAAGLEPGDQLAVDSEIMSGVEAVRAGVLVRAHLPATPADLAATPAGVDAVTKAFLDECARLVNSKVHPLMTYTMNAVGQFLHRTAAAYPELWFAHPSSIAPAAAEIAPFAGWRYWQYGAGARGDLDVYNGSVAALKAWLATYVSLPAGVYHADGKTSMAALAERQGLDVADLWWATAAGKPLGPLERACLNSGDWEADMPEHMTLILP